MSRLVSSHSRSLLFSACCLNLNFYRHSRANSADDDSIKTNEKCRSGRAKGHFSFTTEEEKCDTSNDFSHIQSRSERERTKQPIIIIIESKFQLEKKVNVGMLTYGTSLCEQDFWLRELNEMRKREGYINYVNSECFFSFVQFVVVVVVALKLLVIRILFEPFRRSMADF